MNASSPRVWPAFRFWDKDQPLKGRARASGLRQSRGYAQLYQQRNQDQLLLDHPLTVPLLHLSGHSFILTM